VVLNTIRSPIENSKTTQKIKEPDVAFHGSCAASDVFFDAMVVAKALY
jgi:hypothetical protein